MKELNNKDITSVYELPHIFAHKLGNIKKGRYEVRDNKFYVGTWLFAIIIGNDVFIADRESGAFGNGMSSWNITSAFRELRYNMYHCNQVKEDLQYNIEEAVKYSLLNDIDIYRFGYLHDVVTNPRIQANLTHIELNTTFDNSIYKKLRAKHYKLDWSFVDKPIGKIWYDDYVGWKRYTKTITIDKTFKQVFNGHYLTKAEKEIYNAKQFWYKYIKGRTDSFNRKGIKTSTLEDKLSIYRNEELKAKIILDEKKAIEAQKLRAEQHLEKSILKQIDKVSEWMESDNSILNDWYTKNYVSYGLRLQDENNVKTSGGAIVPLSHCKLLYKIFKKCEANNEDFIANGKSIAIGLYKVSTIQKERLNLKEQYVLTAGCHKISSDIIHKFVEINNLDW